VGAAVAAPTVGSGGHLLGQSAGESCRQPLRLDVHYVDSRTSACSCGTRANGSGASCGSFARWLSGGARRQRLGRETAGARARVVIRGQLDGVPIGQAAAAAAAAMDTSEDLDGVPLGSAAAAASAGVVDEEDLDGVPLGS